MQNFISLGGRVLVLRRLSDSPKPLDPSKIRKILVIRNDNIGDVVCTTPLLDALRRAFPQARLAALVCSFTDEVWRDYPALDALYSYPKASHNPEAKLAALFKLRRVLRKVAEERFDLVLGVRSSWSNNMGWLAYASRGRWRLGPEPQKPKQKRWGFYFNLFRKPPSDCLHEVERCLLFAQRLGIETRAEGIRIPVDAGAAAEVAGFFRGAGISRPEECVVVNMTRPPYSPDRQWPRERFQTLIRSLLEAGRPVLAAHAPPEAGWVGETLGEMPEGVGVFCSRSIREFMAMLSRVKLLVTPEGGSMHLAAAVGTPAVVLWSTADQKQWRPWGIAHRLVGGQGPLSLIGTDEVLRAVEGLAAEVEAGAIHGENSPTPGGGKGVQSPVAG